MSRPPDDLRIALLGYGLGGATFHAPLIDSVAGLRLAFVVTSSPERAAAARRRHPGIEVVPDAAALWRRAGEIDGVVIATPNRTHVPLGMAAVELGLPVVIDKPLAASTADARRLIAAAARAGILLTVFQNRRWDADFLTLRRLLAGGVLGDVTRFESHFEKWRPEPKAGWREDPAPEEAGGLLYDIGSHLIDQALLLFGPVRAVYAELDRRRPGARTDDDAFVALAHHAGARSHLWMSAVAAQPAPRMRALGTRGAWTKHGLDPQEAALRSGQAPAGPDWGGEPEPSWGILSLGDDARRTPAVPGDYRVFYALLARAIRDGGPPPVDPGDALAVLSIIEAAMHSAASGQVVTVA